MSEMHTSQDQSAVEISSGKAKQKHQVPFQCMVTIPTGFQIEKPNTPKLVYDLSRLSMTKEMCKRLIDIDDCGQVEIDLHVLKIKGCISFMVNFSVEPLKVENVYTTSGRDTSISLSCQETIYVDHILKYSVDQLPYYVIDGHHIQVRDLHIKLMKENPQTAHISGVFYFDYE
ncbi:hypothetical protein CBR59_30195 [Bacillus thuringiensis]|uniref:hypothetical protein n=1 Tax=Bacillus thuringiensis TaxID=1428 RepID=UPI000C9DC908|nr:hypothetical protein [Bacillus thuringiensis]PNK22470.1 hypothetical protein CBP87_31305 [Bacillus thuringiensis]PNK46111.1 hypothetical protein CBR59_30195 [Bacillus thuringiensis]